MQRFDIILRALLLGTVLTLGGCECATPAGGRNDGGATDDGGIIEDGGVIEDGGDLDGGGNDGGGDDGGGNDGGQADGGAGDGGDGGTVITSCAVLCHGDDLTPAPPLDLKGQGETGFTGVGAHRSHLQIDATWHRDVTCEDCHLVPTAVGDTGHIDTPRPAETTWASIVTTDGANPSWDQTSCSNYCHGQTLRDGSNTTPQWTVVDGSQARCGSCHGVPPAAPHPVVTGQCGNCHPTMSTTTLDFVEPARHIDGVLDLQLTCTSCHGDVASGNPAPPVDTRGGVQTTMVGVGAHREHLGASDWHKEVLCQSCHLVPAAYTDPGHMDDPLPAELDYSQGLGEANGAVSAWDQVSCSNYCHGQTLLTGGSNTTPTWSNVGSGEATCGTCHGLPPDSPHPQNVTLADCATCHPPVAPGAVTFLEPARHIDGIVDLDYSSMGCTVCHGDVANSNPAPPQDVAGNTDPAAVGVGAHQQHLQQNSNWHEDVQCTDCHDVPASVDAAGHLDATRPADLAWSQKAGADGAAPAWDRSTESCSNYCHGQTLDGGNNTSPVWTTTDGTQAACGTCHGLPPGGTHMNRSDCSTCHPDIAADGQTFTQPAQHIDGNVDVQMDCYSCHGDLANGNNAPPVDTSGAANTGANSVGAHQSHLGASGWHREVFCASCHQVPATINAPGHIDASRPADTGWAGGLGGAKGATPSWNATAGTCTNYCHGQTLAGGTNKTPLWTDLSGTQAACGTCHGKPPSPLHVGRNDCSSCHPNMAADNVTFLNPGTHIDGNLDLVQLTCTTCHGDIGSGNNGPPISTTGSTDTATRGVGAHQSHLNGSQTHGPVACNACHNVPLNVSDTGHNDTARPAELTWGTLPRNAGASPTYDGATANCSNYCHGQTLDGGADTTPIWTKVDGTQGACGTCHGLPPGGTHLAQTDCARCHPDINADNLTFSTPADHVNGVVDLQLTCTSCHGDPASGDPAPPQDTTMGMVTTLPGVGAHQSHVTASSWRADILCQSCHVVPNGIDDPGHRDTPLPAELAWTGGIAQADGAVATGDSVSCSNYCHGQTLIAGGTNLTPQWKNVGAGEAACGTCHGLPPDAPHVAMNNCSLCHLDATAAQTIVVASKDLHINGVVDVDTGCSICHSQPQPVAGYRRQVTTAGGDYDRPSHHVSDGTTTEIVTDADCMVCHEQVQHMQIGNIPDVRLNDPDGISPTFVYDGLGASIVKVCTDCHDSDSALAFDADKNPANGLQPFGDGQVPTDISTGFTLASHNVTTQPELLEDKCLACHGGGDPTLGVSRTTRDMHGSSFPFILSTRIANEPVSNPEEQVCFSCHDATPARTNLEAEFAKGTNGADIFHHPIVDAEQAAGRSVECTDCHNPHQANAADKLRGVAGVDLANNAVGYGTASVRAITQYELCFKCHGNGFNAGRPRTTNKRLDFQPTNSAFHPVSGPGRNTSAALGLQLLGGLTTTSTLECSDCHNNEGTANVPGLASNSLVFPQGPHGSTQPFVMRAAYNTANFGPTTWNRANNALCFLCHDPLAFENNADQRTNFAEWDFKKNQWKKNLHQLHVFKTVNRGISCTNCHYNTHSNEQVTTTDWLIDGTLYDTPPAGFKTRNVSFSPEVAASGGMANPTFEIDTTTRRRQCYLDCHGQNHKPKKYTPGPAGDTDSLTIP